MSVTVDPKVYELAGDFLDDLASEPGIAEKPLSEEKYDDECEAIGQELRS